jgi:hypothetical protein
MTGHGEHSGSKTPMTQTRAAAVLGVTREHLNRVLRGRRQSRSLLARWESLKAEQTKVMTEKTNPRFSQDPALASAGAPQAVDPAAANSSIEWLDICAKIGLTAVVVHAGYGPKLWEVSGFEKQLDSELRTAHLGYLDSVKYFNPLAFFFYVPTEKLVDGLQFIKANLEGIGLLPHSVKIGYADLEAKVWRTFYPAPKSPA